MVVFTPDYELGRRIIEILTADIKIHELLFEQPWIKPSVDSNDTRIYMSKPALNSGVELTVLPRIIIETSLSWNTFEQQDTVTQSAPVYVWTHCIVPRDEYETAEALDVRIRTIIGSTNLTSARIIAGELVQAGPRRRIVEPSFYDAWRLVSPYVAYNVGVLV